MITTSTSKTTPENSFSKIYELVAGSNNLFYLTDPAIQTDEVAEARAKAEMMTKCHALLDLDIETYYQADVKIGDTIQVFVYEQNIPESIEKSYFKVLNVRHTFKNSKPKTFLKLRRYTRD